MAYEKKPRLKIPVENSLQLPTSLTKQMEMNKKYNDHSCHSWGEPRLLAFFGFYSFVFPRI